MIRPQKRIDPSSADQSETIVNISGVARVADGQGLVGGLQAGDQLVRHALMHQQTAQGLAQLREADEVRG